MKNNTKSSITIPPQELEVIEELMEKLQAKSKVEVVRRGLQLLKESVDREFLKRAYAKASEATRKQSQKEIAELEHLVSEGLDED
jgi:Arc/MetJ-type ribon-helix-helix transcriptional regulator